MKQRYMVTIQRGIGRAPFSYYCKEFRSENDSTALVGAERIFRGEKQAFSRASDLPLDLTPVRIERVERIVELVSI